MAAQPAYTPPERPALFRQLPCPHCQHGVTDAPLTPYCGRCHQSWRPARFEALMEACDRGLAFFGWRLFRGNRYRWRTLPCGCSAEHLRYRVTLCRMCGGTGVRYHEASRTDVYAAVGATAPAYTARRQPRIPGVPTAPPMTF